MHFSGIGGLLEGDIPSTLSLESLFTSESLRHDATVDFLRGTRALDLGFKGTKVNAGSKGQVDDKETGSGHAVNPCSKRKYPISGDRVSRPASSNCYKDEHMFYFMKLSLPKLWYR
jgi:hypothetical protein